MAKIKLPPQSQTGRRRFKILQYLQDSPTGCRKVDEIAYITKTTTQTTRKHLHLLQEKGFVKRLDKMHWALTFELDKAFDGKQLDDETDPRRKVSKCLSTNF
jgi:DeoR/GlpR family transcriptional regulator of sugar metabolism